MDIPKAGSENSEYEYGNVFKKAQSHNSHSFNLNTRRRNAYISIAKKELSKEGIRTGGIKIILRPCLGNKEILRRFISKKYGHRTKKDAANVIMKCVIVLSL